MDNFFSLVGFQIQGDSPFIPIIHFKLNIVVILNRTGHDKTEKPEHVAGERFDFDHIRTPIRERHRADRCGGISTEIQDFDPL